MEFRTISATCHTIGPITLVREGRGLARDSWICFHRIGHRPWWSSRYYWILRTPLASDEAAGRETAAYRKAAEQMSDQQVTGSGAPIGRRCGLDCQRGRRLDTDAPRSWWTRGKHLVHHRSKSGVVSCWGGDLLVWCKRAGGRVGRPIGERRTPRQRKRDSSVRGA